MIVVGRLHYFINMGENGEGEIMKGRIRGRGGIPISIILHYGIIIIYPKKEKITICNSLINFHLIIIHYIET